MALKCYYSGVEGEQHFKAVVEAGGVHVLTSFLYLEKTDLDTVKRRKKKYPHLKFMIDSGAHTFQSDKDRYANWKLRDFEDYIQRYVDWLRKNRAYIESCVELDIDWNVGTNVVEGWQRKYFVPLMQEGLDVIFVWHKQRGLEGWEDMCSRFSYVGLPGEFSSEADFNKYMTVAKRYTTKVHGFAATKQSDFRDWPWYSSDSTTWKSCERFGTLIHWDESAQRLMFINTKPERAQFRKDFERFHLDADGIIKDTNYREVTKYALISMRRMEQFYERKYADRLFYYELRLPHPNALMANMPESEVNRVWRLLRPDTLWKDHAGESKLSAIRRYLAAIASVQYRDDSFLQTSKVGAEFLAHYFPRFMPWGSSDPQTFQKEVSAYIAPAAPPPLERVEPIHYIATNNPPKEREATNLTLADLEYDPCSVPLTISDL